MNTTQNKSQWLGGSPASNKTISQRNYNPLDTLLSKLDKVKQNGAGKWIARCPAHDDRSPSLAIKADGDRILIHCFGGCETQHVLDAIGLSFADLMPEQVRGQHVYPREKKPFYAGDILKIILNEARLVYLCATDIHQNKPLDQSGRDRLLLAVKRIGHAVGVATHGI